MTKTKQVTIRVTVEDHDFVRDMGGNYSEIWRLGLEQWAKSYPEFLQKKAQEYKDLLVHCIALQGGLYKASVQRTNALDDLYKLYVSSGRDLKNPSRQDLSWIKAKISKLDNGTRVSLELFLEHCRKRFKDEKQKKLGVEP